MSELSQAVSDLIDMRPVVTRQEAGEAHEGGVHVESHPSLLDLLIVGTGTKGSAASGPNLPIDAEALELWMQIVETIREWARITRTPFTRDHLAEAIKRWSTQFDALNSGGNIELSVYDYRVMQIQAWCARIEAKFDPDERREWRNACPECDVRRIINAADEETFAIEVNVTKLSAECRNCGHQWHGIEGLKELRFAANHADLLASGSHIEDAAIRLLLTRRENRMTSM